MRLYKRNGWYHLDATIDHTRIREALDTRERKVAKDRADQLLADFLNGKASRSAATIKTFNSAADFYLAEHELHCAPKTIATDRERVVALRRHFGDQNLKRIEVEDIVEYQRKRTAEGINPRTINMEVGLLRRIMKRKKQWSRISDDVRMLPEKPAPPLILSPEQKRELFETVATKPDWVRAALAAVIAASTTMRGCEVKGLQWRNVECDSHTPVFRIRRFTTKTDAGERVIPMHRSAMLLLQRAHAAARALGYGNPEHYVFPACERGNIDPTKPMKTFRSAWRSLTRAIRCTECGRLQAPTSNCRNPNCHAELADVRSATHGLRFHDLRHLVVTELAERGIGEQTIMSISGHVNRKMVEHYSHPRNEAKRSAIDTLDVPVPNLIFGDEQRPLLSE